MDPEYPFSVKTVELVPVATVAEPLIVPDIEPTETVIGCVAFPIPLVTVIIPEYEPIARLAGITIPGIVPPLTTKV